MSNIKEKFWLEVKGRFLYYLIAIFVIWPIASITMAALSALYIPYYRPSLDQAILLSLGGMAILAPDILASGIIGLFFSLTLFSLLASLGFIVRIRRRISLLKEPAILFVALILGVSLYYPAILSQPIFSIFGILPVWALTLLLSLTVIVLIAMLASPGYRIFVVAIILVFAVFTPLPTIYRNSVTPNIPLKPPVVLLGIDSISTSDDLSHLKSWTQRNGGAWYTKAVSPGLLTNAVWSSILLGKPVREHRVFHTFQSIPNDSGNSLIDEAGKQGYQTASFFSDQLTCWVGSDFAFDQDFSGPIGWRQLASSIFENSSILLPLIKPVLPSFPFSSVPPNHAGSYTYSIEREFNEILSLPSAIEAPLAVGHSTYLHVPAYPKYIDMSWEEFKRVLWAPAYQVKDRSYDWQDKDQRDDAIPMRKWKLNRIQYVFTEAIKRSRFLERGGRLILFSDHGNRIGINHDNFHESRYHNVMFATFNLPERYKDKPISIMDAGIILGLIHREPCDPVVEFAISEPSEWAPLVHSAKYEWNGRVRLDDDLLSIMFRRLRSHRPWPGDAD